MRLGAHESIAGGLHRAFDRAELVGCETVQIFVKSNRAWAARPLSEGDVARFKARAAQSTVSPVVGHSSYLLNLASPDEELWRKSCRALVVELERCERLGVPYLVLHPGSHVGMGEEAGLERVQQGLDCVHRATAGWRTQILVENTAGQGTGLGYSFEHLSWLLEHTTEGHRLGICLDTCHLFAAGYELRTPPGYEATMEAFERTVGLERLKAVHLNDCKGDLGSRSDRHQHIGKGAIGLTGFAQLLNDRRLEGLPGLLETPKGDDLREDAENLAVLRSLLEE